MITSRSSEQGKYADFVLSRIVDHIFSLGLKYNRGFCTCLCREPMKNLKKEKYKFTHAIVQTHTILTEYMSVHGRVFIPLNMTV